MTNAEKIMKAAKELKSGSCEYLASISEAMLIAQQNTEQFFVAQSNPPHLEVCLGKREKGGENEARKTR